MSTDIPVEASTEAETRSTPAPTVSNYSIMRNGLASFAVTDANEREFELTESTSNGHVWLGREKRGWHLTRDAVKKLLPFLENFVKDGTLLGDDFKSENRALALELYRTRLPVVDSDGNVTGYLGGEDTEDEDDDGDDGDDEDDGESSASSTSSSEAGDKKRKRVESVPAETSAT